MNTRLSGIAIIYLSILPILPSFAQIPYSLPYEIIMEKDVKIQCSTLASVVHNLEEQCDKDYEEYWLNPPENIKDILTLEEM